MEIVPFAAGHLAQIRLRAYEREFLETFDDLDAHSRAIAIPGLSFSLLSDTGEVIACAGIMPLYKGVGEAWTILSDAFEPGRPTRLWGAISITIVKGLEALLASGFHRVQTAVAVDFEQGRRWAEHLGFVEEGIMRKYGPDGCDFIRYARLS